MVRCSCCLVLHFLPVSQVGGQAGHHHLALWQGPGKRLVHGHGLRHPREETALRKTAGAASEVHMFQPAVQCWRKKVARNTASRVCFPSLQMATSEPWGLCDVGTT